MLRADISGLKGTKMNRFLTCSSALALCAALSVSTARADTQTPAQPAPSVAAVLAEQIQHARDLRTKGDLDGAAKVLRQLMLVAATDPRVLGEYGKVLTQQGHAKDAIQVLSHAIQFSGTDWTLYSALGVAYDQTDDHVDARKSYDRALAMKPGEPSVLNNYAVSRMLTGDYTGAAQMLAQLQSAGATNPKIAANLEKAQSLSVTRPAKASPATPAPVQVATSRQAPVTVASLQPPPGAEALKSGVVTQKVPSDPKAGPVRAANSAPRVLPGAKTEPTVLAAEAKKLNLAPGSIVMQKVPADPKAGLVKAAPKPPLKRPLETAKAAAAPSLRTASD